MVLLHNGATHPSAYSCTLISIKIKGKLTFCDELNVHPILYYGLNFYE